MLLAVSATGSVACGGGHATNAHSLRVCPFKVGDVVTRNGAGAEVPKPGNGVNGNADRVNGFAEITITTSPGGVVTIQSRSSEHPAKVTERCQLPIGAP